MLRHATRVLIVTVAVFSVMTMAAAQNATVETAVEGLDPVLLVQGKEAQGKNEIAVVHEGLQYLFASAENRAAFEKDPGRYAVQLHGACARMGAPTYGNPDLYVVHEGKIYLFGSEGCAKAFKAEPAKYIDARLTPLKPTGKSARAARELLDKAAAQAGGKRLDTLTAYQVNAKQVDKGPRERERQLSTTVSFSRGIYQEMRASFGEFTQVTTRKDAFMVTPRGTRTLHPMQSAGIETEQQRTVIGILHARKQSGFNAAHTGKGMAGPTPVELVDVETSLLRVTLGIEPRSGRILSLTYRGRARDGHVGEVVETYSDYRNVDGITIPFVSTVAVDGELHRVVTVEALTINPPVDAAKFTRPAEAANKPSTP